MSTIRITGIGSNRVVEVEDPTPDTILAALAPEIDAGLRLTVNGQPVSSNNVPRDGDVVTAAPSAPKLG